VFVLALQAHQCIVLSNDDLRRVIVTASFMRTCWVLDHPAHVRLLAPFIRSGQPNDIIIACDRIEVRNLLNSADGILPRRQIMWVHRAVGSGKFFKALRRINQSHKFMKTAGRDGSGGIERIVVVGASLELLALKNIVRLGRIKSIVDLIYITDTEVNHSAHNLALKQCTEIILPTHWNRNIDGGFLAKSSKLNNITVHRLDGLHGHVHLRPSQRPSQVSNPPRVIVRRLQGDGIHDDSEVIDMPEEVWDGLIPTFADESKYDGDAWQLTQQLAAHDCVITNSVTLASEASLLGTPTLLISKAQRGFLSRLEEDGYPIFVWSDACSGEKFEEKLTQFLCGIHLTDALEPEQWPNTKQQLAEILKMELID